MPVPYSNSESEVTCASRHLSRECIELGNAIAEPALHQVATTIPTLAPTMVSAWRNETLTQRNPPEVGGTKVGRFRLGHPRDIPIGGY